MKTRGPNKTDRRVARRLHTHGEVSPARKAPGSRNPHKSCSIKDTR